MAHYGEFTFLTNCHSLLYIISIFLKIFYRPIDKTTIYEWIFSHPYSRKNKSQNCRHMYYLFLSCKKQSDRSKEGWLNNFDHICTMFFGSFNYDAPTELDRESGACCIICLRMIGSIIAMHNHLADTFIEKYFSNSNRSISLFFNGISESITALDMSPEEILWFIGNLLNCPLNAKSRSYLEKDGMFSKLKVNI